MSRNPVAQHINVNRPKRIERERYEPNVCEDCDGTGRAFGEENDTCPSCGGDGFF